MNSSCTDTLLTEKSHIIMTLTFKGFYVYAQGINPQTQWLNSSMWNSFPFGFHPLRVIFIEEILSAALISRTVDATEVDGEVLLLLAAWA